MWQTPPPVDREQLLARLVMAQRRAPTGFFTVSAGARLVVIKHTALPKCSIVPNSSHLIELAGENRIILNGNLPNCTFSIPFNVLINTVFVVHGRDLDALKTVVTLLQAVRLDPKTFEDTRRLTGKPSPYVGEDLEAAFDYAQAILVMFTPDEHVQLRPELRSEGEEAAAEFQPRPNVLVEAGMALAMHRDRTVIVEMGTIREVSDLSGIHLVRWRRDTPEKRAEVLDRLTDAGCRPDRASSNRWMTVGRHSR